MQHKKVTEFSLWTNILALQPCHFAVCVLIAMSIFSTS